ncbi:glycosyltransferase [Aquirufa sp.]|jgi:glycosyltransferase involved in cell wall biosynthesis|uniref:glycosyltransferase n=1 Tax=Aquirufa sp. TaxID=2676249 RepID=UPI0037C17AC7
MVESKKLFVGHDANRAGAQLVLLHWLKERKAQGYTNYLLLVDGGSLLEEYKKVAKVWVWKTDRPLWFKIKQRLPGLRQAEEWDKTPSQRKMSQILSSLSEEAFDCIIGNTVSSLSLLRELVTLHVPFEVYVHELSYSISNFTSEEDRKFMANQVSRVYAVSALVKTVLEKEVGVKAEIIDLLPPIIELPEATKNTNDPVRAALRIPANSPIVFSCGLAEWRKGPDVFLEVAKKLIDKMPTVHFIWLGLLDNDYSNELLASKTVWDKNQQVHLLPVCSDSRPYFEAMNLFFLSSREDPFPLVMLEAAHVGKPIVGVRASGGVNDFLKGLDELLVDSWDVHVFVDKIASLLQLSPTALAAYQQDLKKRAVQYSASLFMDRWSQLHSK